MQKIKNSIKSILKPDSILYKLLKKIYKPISTLKYKITNGKDIKAKMAYYDKQVNLAVECIAEYKNKEYITLYNPTWLGVANSTKGLFKNIVPLEQVFGEKNINKLIAVIIDNNIKSVIFSQIVDGWIELIEGLKKANKNIEVKVIWHGNCYEYFSDYTWNLNKQVMELYKEQKIDSFAFVRKIMYEFYKKVGFKSYYLQNNVNLNGVKLITEEDKKNMLKIINDEKNLIEEKIKVGIYNADSRELKNIYTALSAIKLVPNGSADVVPINDGAKKFTEIIELETTSINEYIPTEELLERIQYNDINIYPTYTENSPMFPLESFEVGVPCLLGNNNDYFSGTKLGQYVILDREDDPVYIKEKIIECIKNKDEIMKLYKDWKNEFDKKCNNWVEEFIKSK